MRNKNSIWRKLSIAFVASFTCLMTFMISTPYVKASDDDIVLDDVHYYPISENEVLIGGFEGTQKDVVIPATVTGDSGKVYNVTQIYQQVFASTDIESIVLPDTLKTIDDYVFHDCQSLTTVTFGKNIESIGAFAFSSTNIARAELPDSITYLGDASFAYNNNLTYVKLPKTITSIPSQIFYYCSILETVIYPETYDTIESYAFSDCGIEEISLPEGLEVIEDYAFTNSGIKDFLLPSTLKRVGYAALYSARVGSIIVTSENTVFDMFSLDVDARTIIYFPEIYEINGTDFTNIVTGIIKFYALAEVEVTENPKTSYTAKENFDPSGLTIKRDYKVKGESKVILNGPEVAYDDTTKDDFTFDKTELVTSDTIVEGTYQGSPFTIDITVAKATPTYQIPTDLSEYEGKTLKSVTLPDGFSWKDNTKVIVPNKEYDAIYTPDDTDNYEVVEVRIPVEAIRYTITSNKEDWQEGTITFTCNGRLSDLLSVKIDGIEIDASKYEIKEGSTIVTLKEAYRKELSEAKHSITLVYDGMEVNKEFKVSTKKAPEAPDPDDPDTPDTPDVDVPDQPDTPDVDVPDQPDTPDVDVPDQPDTPEKPKQPVDTGKDKGENKDETLSPDTSDRQSSQLYILCFVLGLGSLLFMKVRKVTK